MSWRQEIFKSVIGTIIMLSLWLMFSIFMQKSFIPNPIETIKYLFSNFFEREIYIHLYISFRRVIISLLISMAVAFPLGIFIGTNKIADNIISPLLYFFYPLPKIVFLPLFFIFFGTNENSRISFLFFILVFQIILSVRDSVKKIELEYIELFKTMGGKKKDYVNLYIPFALPGLFSSLRISIGMAIAVLFFTENFIANRGLGFLILNAMELRNYVEMYSGIVLMSFLGYSLYLILDYIEIKVCFWQKSMLE